MAKVLLIVLALAGLTISVSTSFAGIYSVGDRKGPRSDTYEKPYQLYPDYFDPKFPQ